jgi:hypothetical protein
MDPYLEHPALWPSLHARLIVEFARQLNPLILPRYVASVEDRVFIEDTDQARTPDVWVQRTRRKRSRLAATTTLEMATPVVVEVESLEVREHYVEILDTYRAQKVVTVIELVSPSNKIRGPGRRAYMEKQRATLASECHLVEIDLLRRGRHVLSVPQITAEVQKPYDYLICVNRWQPGERNRFELYPCRLRERLPRFPLPLSEPDPDVPLDVQEALEQVYQEGGYWVRVLYHKACRPALKPADQRWASGRWRAYRTAHPRPFSPPRK